MQNADFATILDQLIQGNLNAFLRLYHSFAFNVDLAGQPSNMRWLPPIIEKLSLHAQQGNGFCMALLGTLYLYGWGELPVDYVKALGLIKRAAGLTNSYGEYTLGFVYLCGWGIAQDNERALYWFKMAAKTDNPLAFNMLAYMIEYGLAGLKKNLTEALNMYRKSAEQGVSFAMYNLGRCYAQGIGVSQDYAAAIRWHEKAANTGNAISQNELAWLYEKGLGTEPDLSKALHYYLPAARTYEPAQENLARLRREKHGEMIDAVKSELGI